MASMLGIGLDPFLHASAIVVGLARRSRARRASVVASVRHAWRSILRGLVLLDLRLFRLASRPLVPERSEEGGSLGRADGELETAGKLARREEDAARASDDAGPGRVGKRALSGGFEETSRGEPCRFVRGRWRGRRAARAREKERLEHVPVERDDPPLLETGPAGAVSWKRLVRDERPDSSAQLDRTLVEIG